MLLQEPLLDAVNKAGFVPTHLANSTHCF